MESSSRGFLPRLEEALGLRATWLESVLIPALKDRVVTYRSLFESFSGVLVKKGLLRDDVYDYDRKASAIGAPPDSALPETGDSTEVSHRIVAYRRQLDFLVEEAPFTLASMDLAALKRIGALLSYVDWGHFGEGSRSPTTRALARLTTKVRLSKDQISGRVLHESQAQIDEASRDIRERLAEIEAWHRESWKAEVRAKVLPQILPRITGAEEERVAETVLIEEAFTRALPGGTWHPQLAHEILAEDQEKLLVSLMVPPPTPAAPENVADHRLELLEAVRGVCRTARDLGYCQEVLARNERAMEKPRLGLIQRIRRWLRRTSGRHDDRLYDIEYRPTPKAEASAETVDFPRFIAEVQELRIVLGEITRTGSRGHRRLQAMDTEQILDFLEWLLRELRQMYHRMDGLNTLFQARTGASREGGARGIKLELLAIENGMKRAEAARRDSIDRAEKEALTDRAERP
jgi:hypothetical protein